jgi:hypothetical protein
LQQAQADGSLSRHLPTLTKVDVLVVDDFAMNPLGDLERRLFLEICDDRYRPAAQRCSAANCRWRIGTSGSAIPPLPTAFWIGWFTMLIALS